MELRMAHGVIHRSWCAGMMGLLLMALTGCATVNPTADYQRTAGMVAEQSGIDGSYSPDKDEAEIRRSVEAMLADGLTVDEAVRVGLLNNRKLQAMFFDVGISRAEVVAAGLPSNPMLGVSARVADPAAKVNVSFDISQSIIELFLIPTRKKIAESQLEQMQMAVAKEAIDTIGRIKIAAYQLISLQQSERIAAEDQELSDRSASLAQRRFEAGETDKLDVNLTQAAMLEVRKELLMIQRDRQQAEAALAGLLGLSRWSVQWKLTDDLPKLQPHLAVDGLVKLAEERRLDVRIQRSRITQAQEELEREKIGVISNLSVGFQHERAESLPNLTGPNVSVTLPIWHQNQPLIAKAEMAIRQRHAELEAALDTAADQVRQAAAAVETTGQLLQFYDEQGLPLGKQNIEIATRSYQAGQHDIMTLIQTQRSLILLRQSYVTALRDYATALAQLEQAVGGRMNPAP